MGRRRQDQRSQVVPPTNAAESAQTLLFDVPGAIGGELPVDAPHPDKNRRPPRSPRSARFRHSSRANKVVVDTCEGTLFELTPEGAIVSSRSSDGPLPVAPSQTPMPTGVTANCATARTTSGPGSSSLSVESRNLMHSSAGRDQVAASLAQLDLSAWRGLLVQLRGRRDAATAGARQEQGQP
jgi:hypothetical protein